MLMFMLPLQDPDMICNAFGLCMNATLKGARTLLHRLRLQKSPLYHAASAISSTETCAVCETVLTELQALSRDQTTLVGEGKGGRGEGWER